MRYLKTNNNNWRKLCKGEVKAKQLEINFKECDRKMNKPKDGIELETKAVKQVIKKNGEVSATMFDAKILASRENGTMSIILQTSPKLGIGVKIEDVEKAVNQIDGEGILYKYQSSKWDMDITLEELLSSNTKCRFDTNYKAHKYDECYGRYCMYLKHPKKDEYSIMMGIAEDGFVYIGDGGDSELDFEEIDYALREMFFWGEHIKASQEREFRKSKYKETNNLK